MRFGQKPPLLSWGITAVIAVAATGAALPGQPATAAPPSGKPAPVPASGTRSVTLITGDRVHVTGEKLSIERASGRARMPFHEYRSGGDSFAIPLDAEPLVAAGLVDRRLFNVTKLIRFHYDDASRSSLPLIVTGAAAARSLTAGRALPSIGGTAVSTPKKDAAAFWAGLRSAATPGIAATTPKPQHVYLDGPVTATLDKSVPQIGAPVAWQAGYTGTGSTVAVLDTGIDTTHPDLAGLVTEAKNFSTADSVADFYGHGTHVASTIAGSGAASQGRFKGVAPGAKLLNVKVLDDSGNGTDSQIIAGMEWAVAHGARVVNMSLGGQFAGDPGDALSQAVNRLSASSGALFVVAAGNSGPADDTIGSPATADAALAVGAVDGDNHLATFSSRGPRLRDDAVKPEITAPGVDIAAAYANMGNTDSPYLVLSGTSMAAPHVSGAAAILAQQHPDWPGARLKAALTGSAAPTPSLTVNQQGAGRVDVARAVTQPVTSSVSVVNHGMIPWPRTDDQPIATPVTYYNSGSQDVTLTLSAQVQDPDGKAAEAAVFAVSDPTVTVPAHGEHTVTLTTDTRHAREVLYSGLLLATAPGISVRIPVSVHPEDERYDVSLRVTDRTGAATGAYGIRLTSLDTGAEYYPYDPSGSVRIRVPKGRYFLDSLITTPGKPTTDGSWPQDDTVLADEPLLDVSRNVSLDLDGRTAKPVGIGVQRPGAAIASAVVDAVEKTTPGTANVYLSLADYRHLFVRPSQTSAPGTYRFRIETQFAKPDGQGAFRGTPYLYNVRADTDGSVPAGVSRTFADADLATVTSVAAAPAIDGKDSTRQIVAAATLPYSLTEYYTPGDWQGSFAQWTGVHSEATLDSDARHYTQGVTYPQRWNYAVFGPSLAGKPTAFNPDTSAQRLPTQVVLNVPMFADQNPDTLGYSDYTSATTTLYRDGAQVGQTTSPGSGFFTVPDAPAAYRISTSVSRDPAVFPLSTKITADWS
ncbi:MAG: hypothetical protein QOJ50_1949, partial [Cryptosporangiaceae bacterium]|nr:hypothetical protein [Cryptosporangiaceae bacterium]